MRVLFAVFLSAALSGCGAAYFSPKVVEGPSNGGDVTVTPITSAALLLANSSPYRPKTLPAIFSRTTGGGSGLRGAGALPEPANGPQTRPGALPTRLPPAYRNGTYRIGAGDVLLLATPQGGNTVEELSGLLAAQNKRQGYTVQDDGAIAIPDLGRIEVANLTLEEAEAVLFRKLVDNQIDPVFSLEVAEFNSQRVSIGGAVNRPTVTPITLTPLHLGEAINTAGGIASGDTEFTTIRLYRDGSLYQIPLKAFLGDAKIQKTVLKAGDSIFVDTTYDLAKAQAYFEQQIRLSETRQKARQLALTQLNTEVGLRRAALNEARANYQARVELDAVDRDYVYLAGEVKTQGRYTLPFERKASLADALFDSASGVPTKSGNVAEVYVLRGSQSGSQITAWHLDARNVANLVLATRFELRPNDIVFVAEQPVTRWSRVVNQITPSLITTSVGAVANN